VKPDLLDRTMPALYWTLEEELKVKQSFFLNSSQPLIRWFERQFLSKHFVFRQFF
jgi:hypothetical protein